MTTCSSSTARAVFAAALAVALPTAVSANDSSAELSVGGLVFTQNGDVSMESEDLTITPETVTVKYRFLNQKPDPVTLTIAFPLPDLDLSDFDVNLAIPTNDPLNFVGFQTKIDGKPVKLDVHQRAFLGDKDVTSAVKAAGLPVLPIGRAQNAIAAVPEPTKLKLLGDGIIVANGTDQAGRPLYQSSWTVKTSVMRKQTFPPGQPVLVEHRYRSSVGVSLDTILRKPLRETKALEAEFQRYRASYCIPDELLKGLDKIAGTTEANVAKIQERRITYILKTGANWAGPIKDFRLLVDKGTPDRLVSFCGDNVTKISPTAFEIKAKDFTPTQDLKILLLGRADPPPAQNKSGPTPPTLTSPSSPSPAPSAPAPSTPTKFPEDRPSP